MNHFFTTLSTLYGLSPSHRHLLILDGHGSYVTLDVIKLAMSKGLDLVILPSHTSHALQLLDFTRFKPFKLSFHTYRNAWTLRDKGKLPLKEDLVA